jgi:acetyl-CoA/propionyl-CoA carboxylase biotin carboxyl carrier protein
MVYGVDLVEQQLRIAAGERLTLTQDALRPRGHAVEVRVYAEDPSRGFLPTGGIVRGLVEPTGEGVRVDSGVAPGSSVGSDYDPMLAKVIAWGEDRAEALHRLDHALAETAVLGVTTNIGFLRRLLADPDVQSGALDTGLVERKLESLATSSVPEAVLAAAAVAPLATTRSESDPWQQLSGWRHGGPADIRRELDVSGTGRVELRVRPLAGESQWSLTFPSEAASRVVALDGGAPEGGHLRVTIDGRVFHVASAKHGSTTYLACGGETWTVTEVSQRGAGGGGAAHDDGAVRSPMPGTVIAVSVAAGDAVTKGQPVAIVEAMKMEHTLTAPFDGAVSVVHVTAGTAVALDQLLVEIQRNE